MIWRNGELDMERWRVRHGETVSYMERWRVRYGEVMS